MLVYMRTLRKRLEMSGMLVVTNVVVVLMELPSVLICGVGGSNASTAPPLYQVQSLRKKLIDALKRM